MLAPGERPASVYTSAMEAPAAFAPAGRRKWLVLLALTPGVFLALADATIMTIALPSMIQTMSSSVTMVSWVLNGYNLVLTTLFLTMGRLGDRSGHKRVFMAGLALFAAASVGCALSPSVPWVVFCRVFQAAGAAAMIPMALTIVLGAFPSTQQGLAAGLFGGLSMLAASVGPALGGLLITYGSWHWIFWLNVPMGAVGLTLTALLVRSDGRERRRERMDLPGVALVTSGLFCLTLGLIQANTWGWLSAPIMALFIAAAGLLASWVFWELRAAQPLFDLRLFRNRAFAAANTAITTVDVAMMGTAFMLVIYLVALMDYSELKAAAAVTFVPAAGLVLSPLTGRLLDRIGPRWLAFGGALLTTVGLVFLAQLSRHDSFADVAWRTLLVGAGLGITLPSLTAAGMTSLPAAVRGVGSGMLNTSRQLGFLLGVAILVAVFAHTMHTSVVRAADQARTIIDSEQRISQPLKDYLDLAIEQAKKVNATASFADVRKLIHPISGVSLPPISASEALVLLSLRSDLEALFTDEVAAGFSWPFMTAAIAALFSAAPALLLQRRLPDRGPPTL
jgi:EmrB/QacA subfamily drug resistance transporter